VFDATRLATLDVVMNGLMRRYKERVPDVQGILDAMKRDNVIQHDSDIENDHVAFRTMGVPNLGIASFEKIFLYYGYEKRDMYNFERKKVTSFWYAPPTPKYPRIFISQLRVEELSPQVSAIIHQYTDTITSDPVDALDLDNGQAVDEFLHKPLWKTPTLTDYLALANESEFASWVIYNRYYLNHFTISVHNLPRYNTIATFNDFVESHGFKLNDAGGKIKVSGDGNLIQSSTVAEMVDAEFDDGNGGVAIHRISGSYVEFAERKVLEQFADISNPHREHRRDGFEAANADKIFESTYSNQTRKRAEDTHIEESDMM
jgi:hypothetical protein